MDVWERQMAMSTAVRTGYSDFLEIMSSNKLHIKETSQAVAVTPK